MRRNIQICALGYVLMMTVTQPTSAELESGCGQGRRNPCKIFTYKDLKNIETHGLNLHYILVNDIDADPSDNFDPIGNKTNPFLGSLNGNFHTIRGLNIHTNGATETGFFGAATKRAYIRHLTLESPRVRGGSSVGALLGYASGGNVRLRDILIKNPAVVGTRSVGGLVGRARRFDSVTCSHVRGGTVKGRAFVGGLVGFSGAAGNPFQGHIHVVSSSADKVIVTADHSCGGLIGYADSHTWISDTYAIESVTECHDKSGGLVGVLQRDARIFSSYAVGKVNLLGKQGNSSAFGGGLVGIAESTDITFERSFASVTVSGGKMGVVGGIIGNVPGVGAKFEDNFCLMSPPVGNYTVRDDEVKVVDSISHFWNHSNEPMNTWGSNWLFGESEYPTYKCLIFSSIEIPKIKKKIRRQLKRIKSQIEAIPTIKRSEAMIKKVGFAKRSLEVNPLSYRRFSEAEESLDELVKQINSKVWKKEISFEEQYSLEDAVQTVLGLMEDLRSVGALVG